MTASAAWSVAVPSLAACLAFVGGNRLAAWVVPAALAAIGGATAAVVVEVLHGGAFWYGIGGWDAPLGIGLYADGLSAFMLALNTGVCLLISGYAWSYLPRQREAGDDATGHFWPLWLFLWAGLSTVYLSADLFNLYVALELLGISAVALVALAGSTARAAALRYLLVTLLASLAYLLGVGLLYAQHGAVDLWTVASAAADRPPTLMALVLMTLGLALKTAILPFYFWLPQAHASALGPISAVLSGLVVKASFYLLVRLWVTVFPDVITQSLLQVLGLAGTAAIVWGSVQAIRQTHLKMLIAYSTVAQLGYLVLAFPLGFRGGGEDAWRGALYFLAAHACAKSALFLAAGTIKHVLQSDALEGLQGLGGRLPLTTFSLALAGITLVGLPPTGGFAAKWMLLVAALEGGQWVLASVMIGGTLLAAGYVFPILGRALQEARKPLPARCPRVPLAMDLSTFVLAAAGVALGLLSREPLRLLDIGHPFASATRLGAAP